MKIKSNKHIIKYATTTPPVLNWKSSEIRLCMLKQKTFTLGIGKKPEHHANIQNCSLVKLSCNL